MYTVCTCIRSVTYVAAYIVYFHHRQNIQDTRHVFTADNGTMPMFKPSLLRAQVRARKQDGYMRGGRRTLERNEEEPVQYRHPNERAFREFLRSKITYLPEMVKVKLRLLACTSEYNEFYFAILLKLFSTGNGSRYETMFMLIEKLHQTTAYTSSILQMV